MRLLGGKIDEHAPRQQRIGLLGTAGDEAGAAAPRDLQRLAEKPGRVIGLPAKTAQPARCRVAPRAIAAATAMAPSVASFSAGKISRGTSRILHGEFGARGVEVADPEFRHEAEGCGMHHAAVGGDDAGAA